MSIAPIQVLVIGCGNIAGGFDRDRPAQAPPLTHAGGYAQNPAFAVAACVEPDGERRAAFMERWGVARGFATTSEALAAGRYDVVSVCSPTTAHRADLLTLLQADSRPRIVFCEKPMTMIAGETAQIADRYAAAGVKLAVNYTRRFDPVVIDVARDLRSGAWGAVRSANGAYNKGLLNNGSHMIDLLHLLLGELAVQHAGVPVHDHWANDPSIPAVLATADGTLVSLSCGHAADYALFELVIVTEHGVLAMEEGGFRWRLRRAGTSAKFPGYRTLMGSEERLGGIDCAMTNAVAEIADAVRGGGTLRSTAANALVAQKLCEAIAKESRNEVARALSRLLEVKTK